MNTITTILQHPYTPDVAIAVFGIAVVGIVVVLGLIAKQISEEKAAPKFPDWDRLWLPPVEGSRVVSGPYPPLPIENVEPPVRPAPRDKRNRPVLAS